MRDSAKNGRTVLVVDDEWLILGAMRAILGAQGYNVVTAGEAGEALRICEQYDGSIHLLITDVNMPGMNGRVLAEQVTQRRPDTQVLYLSGHTDDPVIQHGIRTKTIAFIQKPFSLVSLESKVREVLGDGDANPAGRDPFWLAA